MPLRYNLDQQTRSIVHRAWTALMQMRRPGFARETLSWCDSERDVGFLKDVDGFNTLLEPFLLAPDSLRDLPISDIALEKELSGLLARFEGGPVLGESLFSSRPYPYVDIPEDFVDSAAATLTLVCNFLRFVKSQKRTVPSHLEDELKKVALAGAEFLLESRVEDQSGIRWQAISSKTDPPGKYGNLFFTSIAAQALDLLLETNSVHQWIKNTSLREIERISWDVPLWICKQYDPATRQFWIDASRSLNHVVGTIYALKVLLPKAAGSPTIREICRESLEQACSKMTDVQKASALQTDFYHSIPLRDWQSVMFYDDRLYIGSFLSVLAITSDHVPELLTSDCLRAGKVLYQGVCHEWVDEVSGLWDDGRPLICFTHDALVGIVSYATHFKVEQRVSSEPHLSVFLCHSSADKPKVRELYNRLVQDGFDPWLDEEKLLPGQDWEFEITKAVRRSDLIIVCLSRESVTRAGFLQKEIKFALDKADEQPEGQVYIIPARLEGCDPPERLRRWQWVNLYDAGGYELLRKTLQNRASGAL
jgi:hypothetical protein